MAQLIDTPSQTLTDTVHFYTEQEYLQKERSLAKQEKHEFINGKIIKMGGASLNHNTIFTNFFLALGLKMHDKNYRLYASDMRVNNPVTGSYFYPDITVVRGEPLLKDREFDNLLNPCLIIEIISPGTEEYDRVDKFTAYQSILTLEEYVLVSSDKQQVEYFRRESPNQWKKTLLTKTEDTLHLLNNELLVAVADMYRNVKL
jgi:Uma2 family endonuclease